MIVFVRYYHWVSGLIFQNQEKATTSRELFSNLCGIRSRYKGYFVADMNKDLALQSGRAALATEFVDRVPWSLKYAVPRLIFDYHTLQWRFKVSIICNWEGLDHSTKRRIRRKGCYIPDGTGRKAWFRCRLASRTLFTMDAEASRPRVV